jgi:hypothetical protein
VKRVTRHQRLKRKLRSPVRYRVNRRYLRRQQVRWLGISPGLSHDYADRIEVLERVTAQAKTQRPRKSRKEAL